MMQHKLARRFARPARDFMFGMVLFLAIAVSGVVRTSSSSGLIASSAYAGLLEEEPAAQPQFGAERQVVAPLDMRQQAMALASLALAFSTLFAMNLWFARHLRRVHATQRRLSPPAHRRPW